jgi:GTP cyclohydrolase I
MSSDRDPRDKQYSFHVDTNDQQTALEAITGALLLTLGQKPSENPGIRDTPRRVAQMWMDFIHYDPGTTTTLFEAIEVDQMAVVSGMRVWSFCEHHLLPFWCDVSVGYIASDQIIGLSKVARIAHKHAHKLQLQERLVTDIARELREVIGTDEVAVIARGAHLCMLMRGIETPHIFTSSALYGSFRDDPATRAEFLRLATLPHPSVGF